MIQLYTVVLIAIAAEKDIMRFYQKLQELFSHNRDIAAYWKTCEQEALQRYNWLWELYNQTSPESLIISANSEIVGDAFSIREFDSAQALQRIETLDDAYEISLWLDNYEARLIENIIGLGIDEIALRDTTIGREKSSKRLPQNFEPPDQRRALLAHKATSPNNQAS